MKPQAIQREELDEFISLLDYLYKIYFKLPKLFFYFKPQGDIDQQIGHRALGLSDVQKKELIF